MSRGTLHNICFHGIGEPRRPIDQEEARYWITHDAYLRILDELATWPNTRLTFDDGNISDLERGLPGLLERGLTATFFVLAGRLDEPGSLSRADVAALRAADMGIGSHGMDHVGWRGMTAEVRDRELVRARAVIEQVAGPIAEAALPRGQYGRDTLGHLRALGDRTVHTADRRPARPGAWLQPRFSVTSEDTPATLVGRVLHQPLAERTVRGLKGAGKRLR